MSDCILLVEDHPSLRRAYARTLTGLGMDVVMAADGADAVRAYTTHAARIKLVISDVDMPHLRGTAMMRQLFEHNPALRVVLVSGSPDPVSLPLQPGKVEFLAKPFRAEDLVAAVRRLLADAAREPASA